MSESDFEKGDHVVYPPHGAGAIVKKEKRDGSEYLSIEILHSKMTLMVPAAIAADKGVRKIVHKDQVDELLAVLKGSGVELNENAQQRLRATNEKARSGAAFELAEVIRDLYSRQTGGKKLSMAEQNALATAKQHLASELMYVKGIKVADALELIENTVAPEGSDAAIAAAPKPPKPPKVKASKNK